VELDRDRWLEGILDDANILRSYAAGQCPAIRRDESPQCIGDLRARLVARQDNFGNSGAAHPIGINPNGYLILHR
jgi:hypothetical protein